MHIPDGFITPKMYLPAYGVAAGLWGYGMRRLRRELDTDTIPYLAVVTAFSFTLMLVMLPLPGGTSAHATGIALLAVLFGIWTSFLCITLVLLLQAVLLGAGGVTALPVNALAMGLVGGTVAGLVYRSLRGLQPTVALFAAGWLSVNVSAALLALALGVQPLIAHDAGGTPLFFPFGLAITLPAVMIPHAIVGVGEGLLTVLAHGLITRLRKRA